jgi:hypothetical protein
MATTLGPSKDGGSLNVRTLQRFLCDGNRKVAEGVRPALLLDC